MPSDAARIRQLEQERDAALHEAKRARADAQRLDDVAKRVLREVLRGGA